MLRRICNNRFLYKIIVINVIINETISKATSGQTRNNTFDFSPVSTKPLILSIYCDTSDSDIYVANGVKNIDVVKRATTKRYAV